MLYKTHREFYVWACLYPPCFNSYASLCLLTSRRSDSGVMPNCFATCLNDTPPSTCSTPRLGELRQLLRPLASSIGLALLLAVGVGVAEQGAILLFSFNTLFAGTGIAAAIVSSSVLLMILFGIVASRERLEKQQVLGLALFLGGLLTLSF